MNRRRVVLRADGNEKMGWGHVYRLISLAQLLNKYFECVFVISSPVDEFVVAEINKACSSCIILYNDASHRLPDTIASGEELSFDLDEVLSGDEIVVTDGYLFGKRYQQIVKAKGCSLVCIDDFGAAEFFADAVINHAPGAETLPYQLQSFTKLCTGLDYALLRETFFTPLKLKPERKVAFVSLGGSDFWGYTLKMARYLEALSVFREIHILTTSSFKSSLLNDLRVFKTEASSDVVLHSNLNSEDLVVVLDNCTHAFVSSSTVLIESFSRGLKCFCGWYTENQKNLYNGFVANRFALGMGSFERLDQRALNQALNQEHLIHYRTEPFSRESLIDLFQSL